MNDNKEIRNFLVQVASMAIEDEMANKAMALLHKHYNKTYHWCLEYDFLVICNEYPEWEYCTCFIDKENGLM